MENVSGIHPTADRVLLKEVQVVRMSAGGIELPMTTTDKQSMAELHATYVTAGEVARGMQELKGIAPGDTVLMTKFAGIRYVGRDGAMYRVVNARDIMAKAEGVFDQTLKGIVPLPIGA